MLKRTTLCPLLLLVTLFLYAIGAALAAPVAPLLLPLEGQWRFHTDPGDTGEAQGWQRPEYADAAWQTLQVPGNWESQGVTNTYPEMPCPDLQGVNAYNGAGWYRLRVTIPAAWKGRELMLLLGKVDDLDRAYFNGELIGALKADTPVPSQVLRTYAVPQKLVRFDAENVIAVRVWDGGGPGGICEGPLALFPRDGLQGERAAKGSTDQMDLKERFANPPSHRRILKLVHQLPDDPQALDALLITLSAQGFGGIATNVNFNGYLERAQNWKTLESAVQRAKELGMTLWLYDEQGYPSGNAGGLTLKDQPEWEARGLYAVDLPAPESVGFTLPEGKVVSLAAYPVKRGKPQLAGAIRLETKVDAARKLQWTPPAGAWRVQGFVENRLYEGTHASANLFSKRPYINLLMREPTGRFLELNHSAYAAHFPKLSQAFEATFTDEPSLMSMFMRQQPYAALPWAPELPARFRADHGYDLLPHLPSLLGDVEPDSAKVRCAFWTTVGNLVSENYFGQIQDWCRAHGVASSGHLLAEEGILDHVGYYGNFYQCLRRMDYPGIDCLTSDPNNVAWYIAKLIGSASDLIGAPKRMSETSDHSQRYRPAGDSRPPLVVSADQIRGTCNLLYLNGINTTTSYYSWAGLSMDGVRDINYYVGRLGVPLTGGEHRCDIAVFYPIESIQAHYTPSNAGPTRDASCRQIAISYRTVSEQLFQSRHDFDYLDSRALETAQVDGDALSIAEEHYRVLVLPTVSTLPLEAWQKVAAFWRAGGIVVAVGAVPDNSLTEFPSPAVQALTQEIFGDIHQDGYRDPLAQHTNARGGAGIFLGPLAAPQLAEILDRLLEPDFQAPADSALRYAHRRLENRDFYLVINHSDSPVTQEASFRAEGPAELWDPFTGAITAANGSARDGRYHCSLSLPAYGSVFVAFPQAMPGKRHPNAQVEAALPQCIPFTQATGVKVNFVPLSPAHVDSRLSTAPDKGAGNRPTWRVTAQVKQGEQDCWCFPEMRFAKPLDLSAYRGLLLHTSIPEAQPQCGAELMVFVEQEGGALYLASTGRSLGGEAGYAETPLWFNTLHHYSGPGGATLDTKRITAIRIGWGGYLARTGETVKYNIGGPDLIR